MAARAKAAAAAGAGEPSAATGLPQGVRLEDPSVLAAPGNKDGAVKVVREGGAGVAYQWSASGYGGSVQPFGVRGAVELVALRGGGAS